MERDLMLRKKIMRRVFAVYLWRTLTSPAVKAATLFVVVSALVASVSVKDVVANTVLASHTPLSFLHYLALSFLSTEFFVQLFLVVGMAFGAALVRDVCVACVAGIASGFSRRLA